MILLPFGILCVYILDTYMKEWVFLVRITHEKRVQSGECMNNMHRSQNMHVQAFMPEILAYSWNVTPLTRFEQAGKVMSIFSGCCHWKSPSNMGFLKFIPIMTPFKHSTCFPSQTTTKSVLRLCHSCSGSIPGKAIAEKGPWSLNGRRRLCFGK